MKRRIVTSICSWAFYIKFKNLGLKISIKIKYDQYYS